MKTYERIKVNIKENYKIVLLYIAIFCFFTVKLPYYIEAPGGLIDASERVMTSDNYKLSGSLNMAYVTEIHSTIPTFIWSKINDDWEAKKTEKITAKNENIEDLEYRNKKMLKESNKIAELVAYKYSNIDYEIEEEKIYITYIDEKAKTNLKIGDQIVKVDGNDIKDKNYLFSYISSKEIGSKVTFTTKKDQQRTATLININGEPKVGAVITEDFNIKSSKEVKFKFKESESGPSGGLILALTIYSKINKIDITNGKKIAGTGTINIDGTVGEISGIKYKLIGAVKNKANVFLVPKGENYEEAKKIKNERGYKIDIIPIETFEDALKYLDK
ncbi:MAG: PDZ domain-containing protein [Bacilli bacterium]|nr:PDZ domain-containing protein [Bacilli bacterium]MBR3209411.1 PDZ domain-containing protein [Bacilli bacterium]